MERYLDGNAVTIAIPLEKDGVCLDVSAVEYRITNHIETELVGRSSLSGFTSGDAQAFITVSAAVNTLQESVRRELRVIELYLTTPAGEVYLAHEYLIEAASQLVFGLNSFQTYREAVLLSFDIYSISSFNTAEKTDRIAALADAWKNIGKLYLRYVNELENEMTRIIVPWAESGNVTELTAEQFALLPEQMQLSIRRAQIIEADALLVGDDTAESYRAQGIKQITVGESTTMFAGSVTKPYRGVCATRTMQELSRYIYRPKRVVRG